MAVATILGFGAVALPCAHAQQVAPSRVTPETLQPQAPAAPPQIALPEAVGLSPPPNADKLSVTLGGYDVKGTFPGFEQKTQEILAPLAAGRVTVARIYDIANDLERAYADAGYFLARVLIPPQQLGDGGTVRLTIIDGVISRIDVNEIPERQRDAVMLRLAPLVGRPQLMLSEIERRLLLVSDIPGLQVKSTLSPGEGTGTTLVVLQGTQTYASGTFGVDNRLPSSLGTASLNASASLNSVLGLGEQAYASILTSPEMFPPRLRVLGGGVLLPLGDDGFTVNPEYTNSIARPIAPAGVPATQGDFQRFAVRGTYPMIRGREENLSFQASIEYLTEDLVPIGFATKLYSDGYEAARLRAIYSFSPWKNTPVQLTGVLSQGLSGRDATAAIPLSRLGASPTFTAAYFEGNASFPLPESLLLSLTGRAQSSFGSPLMLSEQFSLDGSNALSAFAQGTFSVDQGTTLRIELARPFALPIFGQSFLMSPYVFGAGGWGELVMPTAVERRDIVGGSFGVGIRSDTGIAGIAGASIGAEFARKISDIPAYRGGYRANLSLNLRF
ncbi:MAG: ShlB/FhaC/HecB family hemolysin secretion/activation protein [Alphaproteobacteria bacterium]|nr:ShlB/FhaC/HecB family hemolysin secretion/activation protein [Alphaproteobacteria bacterium]